MFQKCKKCNGLGKIMVRELENVELLCDDCNGKGGLEIPEGKNCCIECRGSGVHFGIKFDTKQAIIYECSKCSGTGLTDIWLI